MDQEPTPTNEQPSGSSQQDDTPASVIMQDPGSEMTSTGEPIVENEYTEEGAFEEALESSLKNVTDGAIVEGVIVKVDPDEALLDIGYKSEGVIPARELSIKQDVDPREVVQIGDVIEALVMTKEDSEGRLVLSKKRAQYERAWGTIERIFNEDKTVRGTVIEVVKGGLILDIGLRGFLPASLVEMRRVRDLNPYVGTELECKIIELDKNRNNVVLSRRKFLEETQSEFRQEFLQSLQVGEIRKGTVSSIVNFGAFVDLGGVDGLVHVSELAWQHIDHPSEIVEVGDEVEIEVLDVDLERERVSLSLKATQEDPWTKFAREHDVGDIVEGEVTKLVPFGAFVAVAEGIEGLVHISELAEHHVEAPESVVNVGEKIDVKVIDIDTVRRRISLSLKQVAGPSPAARGGGPSEGQLTPEQMALAETAYVSGEGRPGQAAGQSSALGDQLKKAGFASTEEAPEEEAAAEEAAAGDVPEEAAAEEAPEEAAAQEAPEEAAAEEAPDEAAAGEAPDEAVAEEAPEEAAAEEAPEEAAAQEAPDDASGEGVAATATEETTAEPAAEEAPEEPTEEPEAEAESADTDAEVEADTGEPALEGELAGQAEAAEVEEDAPVEGDVSGADVSDVEAETPDTEETADEEPAEAPAKGIAQADEESETDEPEEAPTSADRPTASP